MKHSGLPSLLAKSNAARASATRSDGAGRGCCPGPTRPPTRSLSARQPQLRGARGTRGLPT
eukprot:3467442-Alexandrium_andersonii.AAC.1